jgi:photosystem II stability/assembly factor-like uncharacterized protein
MTSICCAPKKPSTIWGGAAGGGVWKSDDGGQHWRALWHSQPTLNIGSLAVDPTNPSIVYCGTGEANLSADSYPGMGIFRSIDGGENWQVLAPADVTGIPTRIGCLVVDPFDATHLCLGGVTHTAGGSDGMFVSRDGGVSWGRQNFPSSGPYRCHAVVFHPTIRDTVRDHCCAWRPKRHLEIHQWRLILDASEEWSSISGADESDILGHLSV